MTAPEPAERDRLFKTFGRAWFKRDVDLLYEAVTPDFEWRSLDADGSTHRITTRPSVAAAFAKSAETAKTKEIRFADVVYHHAPDATFMTFRLIETDRATGTSREETGVERYLFRDGRIAVKDVYRKTG